MIIVPERHLQTDQNKVKSVIYSEGNDICTSTDSERVRQIKL